LPRDNPWLRTAPSLARNFEQQRGSRWKREQTLGLESDCDDIAVRLSRQCGLPAVARVNTNENRHTKAAHHFYTLLGSVPV